MSAIFAKYPLVKKALEEQEQLAGFPGGDVPDLFRQMVEAYAETAEAYLDDMHEDKEAVMVGCVLLSGSPYMFDDVSRFGTDYSPQVAHMADLLLNFDDDTVRDNASVQQMLAVLGICHNQAVIDMINKDEDLPQDLDVAITKADLWQPQHFPLLEQTAPRLYAAFEKKCDQLLAAIDARAMRQGGAPFKGPRFDF
jgi:hypothetical protein